jgi:double-stranded uracil-DNA glycosylase
MTRGSSPVLDLAAARDRTIPDVLPAPGERFDVLFCGINPGLYSAATGWHFARPGNRFWPALHLSGFTPRRLDPSEQGLLPGYGLGITNIAPRATAQAAELSSEELRAGGERLVALVSRYRPAVVAIAGVTAYRSAFGKPRAAIGPQPASLGGARLHVLPNPSGLNAHWTLPRIADAFRSLRDPAPGVAPDLSGAPRVSSSAGFKRHCFLSVTTYLLSVIIELH